ncbi:hypothetical protein BN134_3876 [Cronobacter dublinensis 1210]|uniref:Uncharacterized protein n=1 Tax=Cronobacter dublinensis 1210 TaxID=1208656 RepID=A0ABP1WF61_9ENTR|nr:hypothetical protein BN134_3876 [Cronobacter dublinensis 1210]
MHLHVKRQAGRDAVRINFVTGEPFRLKEDLVRVAIGEAHHFIFDRRAVARPDPLDNACVHRAAIEVIADHVMGFFVGVRDVARHLARMLTRRPHERKDRHWVVAMLLIEHAEIDSARIDTRRRPGFQATDAQRQFTQSTRQRYGRRIACTAAAVVIKPDMNFAVEESTDRQHHCFGAEFKAHLRDGAHDAIVFHDQVIHGLLEDHQVRLIFQRGTHGLFVQHAIRLSAGSAHGRAFAGV